jgi:thiamine biosynthesis lipoprotein
MKTKLFKAMGSHIKIKVDSESQRAADEIEKVSAWFEEWEQVLSRFRPDSELNRLNRGAGSPMQVSQVLWDVLVAALMAAAQSEGLITPAILDALEYAGYDRNFDDIGSGKGLSLSENINLSRSMEELFMDELTRTVYMPKGMRIDLGGVAKGWAGHQTMLRLQDFGPTLVDAGGDLAISGLLGGDIPWEISIVDPFAPAVPETAVAVFGAGACGVATSGKDYRRWLKNGIWQHHIIDPRTGLPAETDVLTASVIAPTVMAAEIAAKELVILGSRAGMAHIEELVDHSAILVLQNGEVLMDSSLSGKVDIYPTWKAPQPVISGVELQKAV